VTVTEQPSERTGKRSRRKKRKSEPLPPYEGPDAVAPPLAWVRRFTPLGLGKRRVRLSIDGGWLTVTRIPVLGDEHVVVQAPLTEFHSVAPSRRGRGLHLWHGDRLFRLTGKSTTEGGSSPVSTLGDDPISAVIGLILLPFLLFSVIGLCSDVVASQRKNVATTLRWLGPVVGSPPPGVQVRPPLHGGWLSAGRWTLRLAVAGAAALAVALSVQ
jgi:hypothetical protein